MASPWLDPVIIAFLFGVGLGVARADVRLAPSAGLGPGGATVLGVLSGSASYIAAPAAFRLALPDVDLGPALGASLGATFPSNVTFGIPLYYALASAVGGP